MRTNQHGRPSSGPDLVAVCCGIARPLAEPIEKPTMPGQAAKRKLKKLGEPFKKI
jgi:hypothetical protein